MTNYDAYENAELGIEVTEKFRPKESRGTTVLSVRLGNDEIARLERIAQATGKTVSQIAREAMHNFAEAPSYNYWVGVSGTFGVLAFGSMPSSRPSGTLEVDASGSHSR